MSKLIFQGHGSYKLITNANQVIYVDPFIDSDYSELANIILVTHEHQDHNQINLVVRLVFYLIILLRKRGLLMKANL